MKVFEYLGAGIPVISTSLPSLVGEVRHVRFADHADDVVAAIESEISGPSADRETRQAYAARFSWDRRVQQALELLATL